MVKTSSSSEKSIRVNPVGLQQRELGHYGLSKVLEIDSYVLLPLTASSRQQAQSELKRKLKSEDLTILQQHMSEAKWKQDLLIGLGRENTKVWDQTIR